jgi:hypothetical protein
VRRSVGGAEDRGQTDSTEVVLDAAEQTEEVAKGESQQSTG